ncbi:MAG: DUF1801 domain-containing protein [Chloroflexota bacterium]
MDRAKKVPADINEYIDAFPENVQRLLEAMRQTIQKAVPEAEEAIKYGMPTFRLRGKNLISFAAYKKHIGFYPKPSPVDETLEKQLLAYKGSKSSLHFPLNTPLPVDLLNEVIRCRVEQFV